MLPVLGDTGAERGAADHPRLLAVDRQMPGGVPGRDACHRQGGARNAGLLAAAVL
ncbi:MAG: hypothetical protein R2708_28040 [Vicinamibacterales bacterium]